jgi:hypothetical protein
LTTKRQDGTLELLFRGLVQVQIGGDDLDYTSSSPRAEYRNSEVCTKHDSVRIRSRPYSRDERKRFSPNGDFFMVQSKLPVRTIGIAAGLAAISAVTQLTHIGYQSPQFGMWIDIVAVSWIIAFLMFGSRIALTVSLLGALVITFFAPDTWLGASMKWVATTPLWVVLALWLRARQKPLEHYASFRHIIVPQAVGHDRHRRHRSL